MEDFFQQYGPFIVYAAILVGSFVEGESVVLTCSILAYRHDSISIIILMFLAFLGSMSADQTLFFIGRRFGPRMIEKRPNWKNKVDKVFYYMRKHSTMFILSFRFIYGIRTISPIVIGASGVAIKRFALLNFLAAIFWAILSCSAGYILGYAFEDQIDLFFEYFSKYKRTVAIIVLSLLSIVGVFWYIKQKRR